MQKIKISVLYFFVAVTAGFLGAFLYNNFFVEPTTVYIHKNFNTPGHQANHTTISDAISSDFVLASSISTSSVVYIKTVSAGNLQYNTFDWFFGNGGTESQVASAGSGVIYSSDGYIITNNHVIEKSEIIEVVHGKRTYKATIIGRDPSTDLAVLKINGKDLPAVKFGNSKNVKVGEWVLAVGNPFNLNSTVTAGIVSAKARNINIVNSQFPIESFIQTDAAINPGNSGGALVNAKGELIGINTAILSRTGSYAGYGFAVPSDIVYKVIRDLIKYGEVQKAFTGLEITDIDNALAENLKLEDYSGVAINYIQASGAAHKAGLKKGDIIVKINDEDIDNKSTYEEILSNYSPGDRIKIIYKSSGNLKNVDLVLTNREGTTEMLKKETYSSSSLGADLESVSKVEREKLGISSGVRIINLKNGLIRRLGISEGFVITAINKIPINTPEETVEIIEKIRGKVIIEGITSNGVKGYYSYYF